MVKFARCPGSGTYQFFDWEPGGNYPGAVVCIACSFGVLVHARRQDEDGGIVRAHDVRDLSNGAAYMSDAEMRYVS